jgi:hypothetical protein
MSKIKTTNLYEHKETSVKFQLKPSAKKAYEIITWMASGPHEIISYTLITFQKCTGCLKTK